MTLNVPAGVIGLNVSARALAILAHLVGSRWWQRMRSEVGDPVHNIVLINGRPQVFLFDFRALDERFEAGFLASMPLATKVGETPNWLLFMTGKQYWLT